MDIRQLQEVSLELLDPEVLDTELGAMAVHTCPECGNALSMVECSARAGSLVVLFQRCL